MGAAAFWISLALVVIAAMFFRWRSEQTKHETLRQIVEKTGQVNEAQFKTLFEPAPNAFTRVPPPGGGYRALRVVGLLLIFISVGVAFLFLIIGWSGTQPWNRAAIGCAAATIPALLGIGLFVSSRLLPRPLNDPKDLQATR
jgi:hypothetical protein